MEVSWTEEVDFDQVLNLIKHTIWRSCV